jgi:2-oxoglutarate dehydrogenase E2 component (dihydrolipoamide succinyltransferase)
MPEYFLKMPKMGESIEEATVTKWHKKIGDIIELDDSVLEIATDKVDSDVISEVEGVLIKINFKKNEVVRIGDVIAVIETKNSVNTTKNEDLLIDLKFDSNEIIKELAEEKIISKETQVIKDSISSSFIDNDKFYSPLVKSIAKKEGISIEELKKIEGSGKKNRVTKNDIISYLLLKKSTNIIDETKNDLNFSFEANQTNIVSNSTSILDGKDQIIEMSRMEKITSIHMMESISKSAHVQVFIEVDVTDLWNWREKAKRAFLERENEKLTFTTLFIYAIIKALRDYPQLNSIIEGDKIIKKHSINIGMATSLSDGNLIVPVIKNANYLNLNGLAKRVNDIAQRARNNNLKPDEVKDGTYTISNIGNFGSIMGTPIINQPQVGILAIGVIRKMPSVIETNKGDFIGIRRKVILSHSFDHRIINGSLGGLFVKRVGEYIEKWDKTLSSNN